MTVAFLASHIRNYFGDGSELGVTMRYATEETPLGTAGSVRNAAAELDDTFMVISGDVLSDIDLDAVVKAHRSSGALATIALRRVENPIDFGIVITSPDGWVERFLEKPTWGQVFSDTINTGIYVLEPQILDLIPEHEPVDFAEAVFPAALKRGLAIQGLVVDGYWEDVGTVEAYHRAHRDVLDQRVAVDIPGFRVGDGIWLGEGADVDPAAEITGPVIIGDNCRVEAGAQHRRVHRAGVERGGEARRLAVPHGGPRPRLHRARRLAAGLHRGPVGRPAAGRPGRGGRRPRRGVLRRRRRRHQPERQGLPVQDRRGRGGRQLLDRVGEPGPRTLFGRRGVRGLANVDVTAELAVRLAAAYGTTLKKGSVVCCSRDTSRVARTLKRPSWPASTCRASTSTTWSWRPSPSPGSRCAPSGPRAA